MIRFAQAHFPSLLRWLQFGWLFLIPSFVQAADPTPEQIEFFEKGIRPVLVEKCYSCHSAEAPKAMGGLLLDTAEGLLKGGDNGPVGRSWRAGEEFADQSGHLQRSTTQNAADRQVE
jgi:hypothetical protein